MYEHNVSFYKVAFKFLRKRNTNMAAVQVSDVEENTF
jgi:hypothetical protein